MASLFPRFLCPGLAAVILAGTTNAAVVFKSGERAKYVAPGEEEINGNAKELFDIAQKAEERGNLRRAINAYRSLVRRHPKDALAAGAAYRASAIRR